MLRFTPIENAAHAESYYAKSDGGYYLGSHELGCEWLGKGAAKLGLSGRPDNEHFKRLIHGLDPHTGKQLTAKLIEDRIPGWDVTASVPKGVTTALERGDTRVQGVIRWAMRKAFDDIEQSATTRVRKGGKYEDRITGNLAAYAVEHPETRPTKEDGRGDWDRHWHLVVFNLTHDAVEDQWKAVKFRPIMDLRKYFSHRFDMYLSRGLTELGYDIETKFKTDRKGGRRYYSWDIKGIPQSVLTKFSRRSAEVDKAERDALQEIKDRDPNAPDELSPVARDKLGATSRMHKRDDLTLEDYRAYWNSRITPEEGQAIADTIKRAQQGKNAKPANTVDKAAAFAMEHWFYRKSVLQEKLKEVTGMYITAMERCMGAALPGELDREFQKQGVISDRETLPIWNADKEVTSAANYKRESSMTGFAREGRGKERPVVAQPKDVRQRIGASAGQHGAIRLTDEQQAAIRALVGSRDTVNVVDAGQGTGKTTMLEQFGKILSRYEIGTTWLGTTHTAVRELTARGLPAQTVAAFLNSQKEQRQAAGTRIIVDETSLLSHHDAFRLCTFAQDHHCRIDFVGDSKQYKSPAAGDTMRLLTSRFTGVVPITMKKTMRQQGQLKEAMEAIRDDKVLKGHDMLSALGCVRELPLDRLTKQAADLYLQWTAEGDPVPVISPTHAQAHEIAAYIRQGLRERGDLKGEDHVIRRLVDLKWSPPQLTEAKEQGAEGMVLTRNAAYAEETQALAVGDLVRTTMGGKTKDGKHRIYNGQRYSIKGFTKDGDPILSNGWVVDKDWGGLVQRYVGTGQGAQGITEKRAIVVYGTPSLVATRQEGFYVPCSRVSKELAVLTDSNAELRKAIQRQESRTSAMELMHRRQGRRSPWRQRLGKHFAYLRRLAAFARTHERRPDDRQRRPTSEREMGYGR
ncbi:MAG TPA: MobF family relaxase [Gemmataceae bacterium]|jgi:conjugative relaxase-like TrwC/TraI family protein